MRYLSAISMQANVPEQYIEQARLEARNKIAGNKKELNVKDCIVMMKIMSHS